MHCGLLGRSLGHSLSPEIHGFLGDYEYDLICLEPDELRGFFAKRDFDGLNVTIPYKKDALGFCDELSDTARMIGSVNTVVRRPDGSLYGDNTDYFGFGYLLTAHRFQLAGKKVLILGNGGASLAVQAVVRGLNPARTVICDLDLDVNYNNLYDLHGDSEVIINTTPVGMFPKVDGLIVQLGRFPKCEAVADIIFNPLRTQLLLAAKRLGIPYAGGLEMLVAQAHRSSELFQGKKLDAALIEEINRKITIAQRNIVLIGMPGSGKSSVARELSRTLGMPTVDTDELIVKMAGMDIPAIFAQRGEPGFRETERAAVAEAGALRGTVISVGGGAVLAEANRDALSRGGIVVYLTRGLSKLDMAGRPLSKDAAALEKMARERGPVYRAMADVTVDGVEGDIPATAKRVRGAIGV